MLTQEIAVLSKDIADLDAAMEEATVMRSEEKEKNKETIKDAEDAHKAVVAAVAVLKEFYKKATMATGLVQIAISQPAYGVAKKEAGGEVGVSMGSEEWKTLGTDKYVTVDK